MYKLLNKLFGYDYILVQDGDRHSFYAMPVIRRIRKDVNGTPYIRNQYNKILLLEDIKPRYILWLTCKESKYFSPEHK